MPPHGPATTATYSFSRDLMALPRKTKHQFTTAPQSVSDFVAAVLEPALSIAAFVLVWQFHGHPIQRPELVLCLLVALLSFPGRNRLRGSLLGAVTSILTSWAMLLGVLALLGLATGTLNRFPGRLLSEWALWTPVLQLAGLGVARGWIRAQASNPASRRRAIIVGAAMMGGRVAHSLFEHHEFGTEFLGYFDDRSDERLPREHAGQLLGGLKDVAAYVRAHKVDDVFITLPLTSQQRIVTLLQELQNTTASMYFVPDVFGVEMIKGRLRDVDGIPVIGLRQSPITEFNGVAKRLLDLGIGIASLVLTAPLLLLIALGIRLSSPGPIVLRQRRYGLNGQEIQLYRFRTTSLPGQSDPVAPGGASRLTPLGHFLRRHGLDALPQLINVIQGRLSVVGPRPQTVTSGDIYRKHIPTYMVRHMVKPGMTGWAQIQDDGGEEDLAAVHRRIAFDLDYLREWSVGLDLRIIGRTILRAMFNPSAD